jgi:predicted transcriptional regulator of viral defense system
MKTHRNTERLIRYLREQHQPVTVARVAIAGVMNRRDASEAMQYGVRNGAIERIKVGRCAATKTVGMRRPPPQARLSLTASG